MNENMGVEIAIPAKKSSFFNTTTIAIGGGVLAVGGMLASYFVGRLQGRKAEASDHKYQIAKEASEAAKEAAQQVKKGKAAA